MILELYGEMLLKNETMEIPIVVMAAKLTVGSLKKDMNDQLQALLVIRFVEMANWKTLIHRMVLQECILMSNVIILLQEII